MCRIHITKFTDPDADASNGFVYEVTSFMQAELRIKCSHELFLSHILIFDLSDFGFKNVLKYTPTINSQLVNIMVSLFHISTALNFKPIICLAPKSNKRKRILPNMK